MSSCPPQDFYLLVPSLFHHIVLACSTNNLNEESLKGGLEYLVDTFLLPSLIPGITWLSAHLWEYRGDASAVLQILSALIVNPANISNNPDAAKMLNSILNIISKPLEHSLRWLQRQEPQRQDIEPLSRALRNNLGWERRSASDHTELEIWTATPGGGLVMAVKHTLEALLQWSLNPGTNINPAHYTHRQILVALRILGARRLLSLIVDEVKSQTEVGNGSAMLDVAISLICAPEPTSWDGNTNTAAMGAIDLMATPPTTPLQRRMNLREALKIEAERMPKVIKTDAAHAETVVRLYRRVEAQMLIEPQVMMGDANMAVLTQQLVDGGMAGGMGGSMGVGVDDGMGSLAGGESDLMSGLMGGELDMGGDMEMGGDDLFEGMGDEGMFS